MRIIIRPLTISEEYQTALVAYKEMIDDALTEIDEYYEHNAWLHEIHAYCNQWTADSLLKLRGAPAFTIEVSSLDNTRK